METDSSRNSLPPDECTKDLDLFFANGLYNSCEATDELIKSIEDSQDEALASKALTLYQRHYISLEEPWNHVTFMYGLGLIYMHFNAYSWAIKAFRDAIYVRPDFARSRDVHTRLGLIFKTTGRYKISEKHFKLAINDTRPKSGTSTRLELEFHIAHLYEIQGKLKQAKEAYERLLQQKDLPQQLSANIHRQLGCMYFYSDVDTPSKNNGRKQNMFNHQNQLFNSRMDTALNHLHTSYRTDSDPKTSYCLGRCFTNIGKFQEAFTSYRSVIDREESTADTWCSIGVLYQRQNQPTDALQAYIRSVQFDKHHSVAWMNLGILYESYDQFLDALKCYQHVLRSSRCEADKSLQARIKYIQKKLAEIETSLSNNSKSKISSYKLLSLEDLWNLESKTSSAHTTAMTTAINTNHVDLSANKSPLTSVVNNSGIGANPPPQQPNNIHWQPNLNTEVKTNMDQLKNGPIVNHNNASKNDTNHLKGCASKTETPETDSKSSKHLLGTNSIHPNTQIVNHTGHLNDCKTELSTLGNHDFKPKFLDSKDFCLNQALTNGASKDSGISSNSSTYADCALVSSQNASVTASYISAEQVIEACKNSPKPWKIDVNVLSDENRPPHTFPSPPPYPSLPPDKLFPSPASIFLETKKDLTSTRLQSYCQSNPISVVRNIGSVLKLDLGLFSTKALVDSNPDHQVDILSHLYHSTSENLDETSANQWACECQRSSHSISSYANYQYASLRESLQEEREFKSSGSKMNLTKESETDSNESASAATKRSNNNSQTPCQFNYNEGSASNNGQASNIGLKTSSSKKFKREQPKVRYVKSADKIDLSDDKKWRPQLNELNKLPSFIKCVSASNMLTHVGSLSPGINTTSMSMHVPGCRIFGNRSPNNFCSVNINVGPGDYEWCAISAEYTSVLSRLCNRNGFELDDQNWWPKISDLQKYNIPIYRFAQRPGDLVWVNSGTIYWIQSTGWCNNIYWNVGPLCARQYKSASESFELNKLLFRKSDVPMVQLTWNIVININIIFDDELYCAIADVLRRSLRYCLLVKDLIDQTKRKNLHVNNELGPKSAKFCSLCESEVFNIYFHRKLVSDCIHCIECARRFDTTFEDYEIKQEYDLLYLMKLYDNYIETKKKIQTCQQARQD